MGLRLGSMTGRERRLVVVAAAALMACSGAACVAGPGSSAVGAASQSQPAAPASATPKAGLPSYTTVWPGSTADAAATSSAEPQPTRSPSPSPNGTPAIPTGPMPSLGAPAADAWTGIHWTALPLGNAPSVTKSQYLGSNAVTEGWSDGFLDFVWDAQARQVTVWTSTDGLSWTTSSQLDISPWASSFAKYDAATPEEHDACSLQIRSLVEGRSALLLTATMLCDGGCAGWTITPATSWTSPDGVAWAYLDRAAIFGAGNPYSISGGPSGFVGLGGSQTEYFLWLSTDGRSWSRGTVPADVLTDGSSAGSPASFAGGYVLPSVIHGNTGSEIGATPACAGIGTNLPPTYVGALWWSTDGSNWTRDGLPGVAAGGDIRMQVEFLDDHTLLAAETKYDSTTTTLNWISSDGKTWVAISGVPDYHTILSDSARSLIYKWDWQTNQAQFWAVDGDALVPIVETGDMPWWSSPVVVLGPKGLLAYDGGSRFWVGVPTAG
jgi:hypothetical protein